MHGLWHSLLQQRLSAGQPDSRLERSGLPRALARRARSPARHEQLPRVHRAAVSRAVRVGVRAGHQQRSGRHQAGRGRDHRSRLGRRVGHATAPDGSNGQAVGRDRLGSGRFGCGTTADASRTRGDRAGARRSHRRPAAVRHPRVQDGEAPPRPSPGTDGGRGHRVPYQRNRGRKRRHRGAVGLVRRRRAGRRRNGGPRPSSSWAPAAGHPSGHGVPTAGQPSAAGRPAAVAHRCARQARRDHRWGRHGGRLLGHRAPPGRRQHHATRDHAAPARPARQWQSVAHVQHGLQGHLSPRRGWRARVQRQHRALRRCATVE